ncbi:MAG: transcription elongation factor GreA [Bacteroidetes bacterium RBG_13_46_8]|nr:MAG: transcription elongation factor GreA [Bacteroidetes bacterium RBG_13_46_8]
MNKVSYITEEGLQKLKDELDHLINIERPGISRLIAEARDKGDLTENAEYEAAKEAQGMLEMKINKVKEAIINCRIIDGSKIDTDRIQIMNRVKIRNTKNNTLMEYTIVSDNEADLKQGKIAVSTPIAKGLIGKKVGDVVEIKVPMGIIPFEIVKISV